MGRAKKPHPRQMEMRIRTIGDILPIPLTKLQKSFGPSAGQWLYDAARGLDDSPVTAYHHSKSVGHETTFGNDTADLVLIKQTLAWLSEKSCYRLRRLKKKARTISLKLRYDDFQTITRARTLRETHDDVVVMETAWSLFEEAHVRRRKIRLLGVSLSKFETGEEAQWLFPEMSSRKKEALYESVDAIKRKYGFHKLEKAASLDPRPKKDGREGGPPVFQKPRTHRIRSCQRSAWDSIGVLETVPGKRPLAPRAKPKPPASIPPLSRFLLWQIV